MLSILCARSLRSSLALCRVAGAMLLLGGCASMQQHSYHAIEKELRADQPENALALLDEYISRGSDRALYSLNRAMILRQAGDFQGSVEAFENAKAVIGVLDATSISESFAAYTLTEQLRSYQATTYEKLFVHLYQIMNFLALRDLAAARVEVMQIDLALTKLSETGHHQAAAAARYVSGLVFDALKEKDSALIAYRQAYENYLASPAPVPFDLQKRLVLLTGKLGLEEENQQWRERFAQAAQRIDDEQQFQSHGELIILYDIDFAPYKQERSQTVVDPGSNAVVRISLPFYQTRGVGDIFFESELDDARVASEPLANIEAIALDDLDKQMPQLTVRAISRNVARNVVSADVREENSLLGDLLNIAGALLDSADIRSWRTLSNRIHIASHTLQPGIYSFEVSVRDNFNNQLDSKTFDSIEIKPNEKTLLTYHWIEPLNRTPY